MTIESNAFALNCFQEIFLPKSLKSFTGYAFNQIPELNKIEVESGSPYFVSEDNFVFDKSKTQIVLSPRNATAASILKFSSISKIGQLAFSNVKVSKIAFGANIQSIDTYAFAASLFRVIDLTKTKITSISSYSFSYISSITVVYFPDSITKIEDHAFFDSTIKYLSIPPSVSLINDTAFESCRKLKVILYFGSSDFSSSNFITNANCSIKPKICVTSLYTHDKFGGADPEKCAYQYGLTNLRCSMKNYRNTVPLLRMTTIMLIS